MSSPYRPLRHAAALGVLAGAVLAAYHVAASAGSSVASLGEDRTAFPFLDLDPVLTALGRGYDLSALRNLQRTVDYVRGQYVDPRRIDPDAAFAGALDEVERTVPEALLRYDAESRRLQVAVGDHSELLTVKTFSGIGDVTDELRRIAALLDEHLPEAIERPDVEYALINGLLGTLDPHSVFLPPERSKRMEEDNEGAFGGLGIQIALDKQRRLKIEIPLEDTPAWRAGLQPEDRIVQIDGEGTLNMDLDEAVRKMRGQPGTQVTLTIDREGFASPRDFTITRAKINQAEVWGRLLPGNVGYVRIDQFHGQVETQLDATLASLSAQAGKGGLKGIVLDLRDNPGGFLHQAVAVVDRFQADGPIVSTRAREGRGGDVEEATAGNEVPNVPVAVLTTGNSASASEIVAGALKNTGRAVIVGERTFGKGSVQNLYPFADTSRLKLTIAKYFTPGDHSIQGVGIAPDIALERAYVMPPKEFTYEESGVEKKAMSGPRVGLFGRDRLQREADLAGHFDSTEAGDPPPAHILRYLHVREEGERKVERADVTKDAEVMIARELLVAAKGASRADVLKAAGPVVATRARAEEERIKAAFAVPQVAIDWSACAPPTGGNLEARLVLGSDGVLDAGELEPVTLEVTNRGSAPVCRVIATTRSGNAALDGTEFAIGRIAPGATGRFTVQVRLTEGYPTETAQVDIALQDDQRRALGALATIAPTRGVPLPRYAFGWTLSDKEGGNGDGVLQVGEVVALSLRVENQGEGNGGVARFFLKKDPGMRKAIVLEKGEARFTGMAAGATGDDVLRFRVAEAPEGGVVKLDLRGYDEDRYDYATVEMAGFRDWFDVSTTLELPVGQALPSGRRAPPQIQITRAPGATETGGEITISGAVRDDNGVKDVIIYAGEDKIAYEGGATGAPAVGNVPFSATAPLKDGTNVIVILARDADGMTSTRAVTVHKPAAQVAKP
jgi:carboxyl-terminal processing protease